MSDSEEDLFVDSNGHRCCWWCAGDDTYQTYHDQEWGVPVRDDRQLFEKICLEGFQAGLSWLTILKRRDRFRQVFHHFHADRVARMRPQQIERLLQDPGIIRHRGKIEAVIHNASRAKELQKEYGSLAEFFWSYQPLTPKPVQHRRDVQANTAESRQMSGELKKRGWKFVGPTTCYAFMQSMGIVNDHLVGCHRYRPVEAMRRQQSGG